MFSILRGIIGLKSTSHLQPYRIKKMFSLPPYINAKNRSNEPVKSTRKFSADSKEVTERGDEESIHPERRMQIISRDSKGKLIPRPGRKVTIG